MKKFILSFIVFTSVLLSGCYSSTVIYEDKPRVQPNPQEISVREYSVQSVMWQQNAAEYQALCYQAFNLAQWKLMMVVNSGETYLKPLAIITDIDETVMDNSPYNAKLIEIDEEYTVDGWIEWTSQATAKEVPGASQFLNYAKLLGIEVFYVSNRTVAELESTIENMKDLNFPYADEEHVLLKTTTSSKKERFEQVREKYEVVLYLGDNLGDFSHLFEANSTEERARMTESFQATFGDRFIVLPNPMYGDWETRGIYRGKYDWTNEEKDSIRKRSLRGY